AALADTFLLIFTSKLAVGIDITRQWDRVFVHCANRHGAMIRQLGQMSGRIRHLTNPNIPFLLHASHLTEDPSCVMAFPDTLKDLYNRGLDVKKAYLNNLVRIQRATDPAGQVEFAPDAFTELLAYCLAPAKRDVLGQLERFIED